MSSNELRQLIANLPVGVIADMVRYGIDIDALEVEHIELLPIPQEAGKSDPFDDCQAIDLPTEVIHNDLPVFAPEAAHG